MAETTEPEARPEVTAAAESDAAAAAKERFREALERKNAAAHRSSQASRNTGAVHGPEDAGAARRMFRRKSG